MITFINRAERDIVLHCDDDYVIPAGEEVLVPNVSTFDVHVDAVSIVTKEKIAALSSYSFVLTSSFAIDGACPDAIELYTGVAKGAKLDEYIYVAPVSPIGLRNVDNRVTDADVVAVELASVHKSGRLLRSFAYIIAILLELWYYLPLPFIVAMLWYKAGPRITFYILGSLTLIGLAAGLPIAMIIRRAEKKLLPTKPTERLQKRMKKRMKRRFRNYKSYLNPKYIRAVLLADINDDA